MGNKGQYGYAPLLTGRNRTGPPCSVVLPTSQAPGGRQAR